MSPCTFKFKSVKKALIIPQAALIVTLYIQIQFNKKKKKKKKNFNISHKGH